MSINENTPSQAAKIPIGEALLADADLRKILCFLESQMNKSGWEIAMHLAQPGFLFPGNTMDLLITLREYELIKSKETSLHYQFYLTPAGRKAAEICTAFEHAKEDLKRL